ncbi:hypothetical protein [Peribacillus frigoritolerans]|uniref:hypothetical protein n=1 Tax=Peribacillus frigoritolerans TaxID=450367 RepID=UPI00207A811D|nr:hypothetical protein [Peribacillus frigoritolerans]USK77675.1 hypothetical protein LIT31_26315 [Peribacillus frigoritolerans]USK77756.1 hypothetical protein LIT31_25840 [Peribacillus frigoritolerans]USK77910.1 hypothetical protein LIT31_26890 [Peribacillus frigoritolerans]
MKVFFHIGPDNRIKGWGDTKGSENDLELDLPKDHEALRNPYVFRYENGELIKDSDWQEIQIQKQQSRKSTPSKDVQIADLTYQLMEQSFATETAEMERADMAFLLMDAEAKADEAQTTNADLLFQLMEKGVI